MLASLARVQAALCLQMSRNVAKCIRMSRQFQFFGTLFCVLPNRSSPSLKDTGRTIWGHFAAFQLTAFTCKFSLGESSGFSVRAPRMSTKRACQGYFLDSGSLSRPCPNSMQLSWVRSTQVDGISFFWTFFLISQTVPPADSGSLTRFVSIRCNCLGFGRVAMGHVGVFPFFRPLHACVRKRFLAVFYRYRKMKYGQLTDVQRPTFGFRYSFGESHGFSVSEETQLISDTIIAYDLGPKGAPLTRIWTLH